MGRGHRRNHSQDGQPQQSGDLVRRAQPLVSAFTHQRQTHSAEEPQAQCHGDHPRLLRMGRLHGRLGRLKNADVQRADFRADIEFLDPIIQQVTELSGLLVIRLKDRILGKLIIQRNGLQALLFEVPPQFFLFLRGGQVLLLGDSHLALRILHIQVAQLLLEPFKLRIHGDDGRMAGRNSRRQSAWSRSMRCTSDWSAATVLAMETYAPWAR